MHLSVSEFSSFRRVVLQSDPIGVIASALYGRV